MEMLEHPSWKFDENVWKCHGNVNKMFGNVQKCLIEGIVWETIFSSSQPLAERCVHNFVALLFKNEPILL